MNGIKIPENLFFNDYFNFYLDKYYYNNIDMNINNNYENSCYLSYGNHKVLNLLLKLRFQENKKNSEENDDNINDENDDNNEDNFKKKIKKICWLESNVNYIIDIVVIYNELKQHFQKEQKNDENEEKLFKIMENNMKDLNIKYITNEDKNPDITKYVNECYYLILASIVYSVLPPYIDFTKLKNLFRIKLLYRFIKKYIKNT